MDESKCFVKEGENGNTMLLGPFTHSKRGKLIIHLLRSRSNFLNWGQVFRKYTETVLTRVDNSGPEKRQERKGRLSTTNGDKRTRVPLRYKW